MRIMGYGLRVALVALALAAFAGCASAPKRAGGAAADTRQCGEFCRKLDACLGSEFDEALKTKLCELARCESGCRARVRAAAGYEGAYQYAARTWRGVCGPIFDRRGLDHCRGEDARNDLCCASVCAAEMIAEGGIRHWPTCGK